jgi:hypothetical protein
MNARSHRSRAVAIAVPADPRPLVAQLVTAVAVTTAIAAALLSALWR